MEFELVLPCYNEGKSLRKLVDRAISAAQVAGYDSSRFNLILVDNGSRDDSRAILTSMKADPRYSSWFRLVPIDLNQGYGFGLKTGLDATKAPFVAWSHADQQCDPQDAFRGLAIIQENPTEKLLAKGIRRGRSGKEKFVSRTFDLFARVLLRIPAYEINAQPKVFRRELITCLTNPPNDFAFDIYVLYQAYRNGYKVLPFLVDFPPRAHGLSNWASSLRSRSKTILKIIGYMAKLGRGWT